MSCRFVDLVIIMIEPKIIQCSTFLRLIHQRFRCICRRHYALDFDRSSAVHRVREMHAITE